MHPENKTEFQPCVPGVFPGGLSRTRFFDGMMLTQAVLEREQRYWRMKRRLTNRALGQGVVWGLRLRWDARTCRFLLGPGYAIDCCGNDLIVECPQEIPERALVDKLDPAVRRLLAGETGMTGKCPPGEDRPRFACIVLKYEECFEDPEKVYKDPCSSNVTRCEFASVRESTRLLLVPPPPPPASPIEDFCDCLAELRESKEFAGLFPGTGVTAETDELPVGIRLLALSGEGAQADGPGSRLDPVKGNAVEVKAGWLRLLVEPDPGYTLLGGAVGFGSTQAAAQPFETRADILPAQPGGPTELHLVDFEIAPLLWEADRLQLSLSIALTAIDADTTQAVITSLDFTRTPASGWCGAPLLAGPWLTDDPACAKKVLALSALCGWFQGLLGEETAAAGGAPTKAASATRRRLASTICFVAWRLLFGADLKAKDSQTLVKLLERLFRDWCCGFVYPGPRCVDEHHGVYLGCVELSPNGTILRFDPWEHRRHVLTGPLLEHWGRQFGLAPVDVVVSRFVRWICCVAETKHAAAPGDLLTDAYVPLTEDGAALFFGSDVKSAVADRGLELADDQPQQPIDLAGFVGHILRILVAPPRLEEGLIARRVYSVDQLLHLLIPVEE